MKYKLSVLPHIFSHSQQKETGISGHDSYDLFLNAYSRMSRHALLPKSTAFFHWQ